jgi:hypothetical protein
MQMEVVVVVDLEHQLKGMVKLIVISVVVNVEYHLNRNLNAVVV